MEYVRGLALAAPSNSAFLRTSDDRSLRRSAADFPSLSFRSTFEQLARMTTINDHQLCQSARIDKNTEQT
jgi:hypothetical protein